jgi:hypothetical protein
MTMQSRTSFSARLAVATLLVGSALPALALTMRVQTSGSFAADAPLTPFSTPGGRYTLSFTLEREPALMDVADAWRDNHHTTPQFGNFEYRLNGELLPVASFVFLYSAAQLGGMELVFGGIQPPGSFFGYNALQFYGAAYYSGTERNPVIEAGLYPTFEPSGNSGVAIAFEGRGYWQPAAEVTISAVPVPPSAALLLAGLVALATRRRIAQG